MTSIDNTFSEQVSITHDGIVRYLSLVRNLENFPYSQRIFLEVREASMNLLKEHVVKEGKGPRKKRIFEHVDAKSGLGLRIEYHSHNMISNFLKISYIEGDGPTKTLDLMSSLGIQNIMELERGDEVTRITRGGMNIISGRGLRKILDTLTQYQPDILWMYRDNALVSKTVY